MSLTKIQTTVAIVAATFAVAATAGPAYAAGPVRADRHVVAGADGQGFLDYPGARCNYINPAVMVARTTGSLVVICITGAERYYYKAVRLSDGASIELDDPVYQTPGAYLATNGDTQYFLSYEGLRISNRSGVIAFEPALDVSYG